MSSRYSSRYKVVESVSAVVQTAEDGGPMFAPLFARRSKSPRIPGLAGAIGWHLPRPTPKKLWSVSSEASAEHVDHSGTRFTPLLALRWRKVRNFSFNDHLDRSEKQGPKKAVVLGTTNVF